MNLTPLELDCFQEIVNMSYGEATSIIAETMDAFATLHVPNIEVYTIDKLKEYVNLKYDDSSQSFYLISQMFNGKFDGELLFLITQDSANNLAKYLNRDEDLEREDILDTVMELINVVTSSTITNIAKYINTEVYTMRPTIDEMEGSSIITNSYSQNYSKFIIISTVMEFKDQNIVGELLILLTEDAYVNLKEAIGDFLNGL